MIFNIEINKVTMLLNFGQILNRSLQIQENHESCRLILALVNHVWP